MKEDDPVWNSVYALCRTLAWNKWGHAVFPERIEWVDEHTIKATLAVGVECGSSEKISGVGEVIITIPTREEIHENAEDRYSGKQGLFRP